MSKKKIKQNKKRRLNPLVIVALMICALAVIYSSTTAWLTNSIPNPIRFTKLEDFNYQVNIYFEGGETVVSDFDCDSAAISPIEVNYSDPNAANYVGKLRVEIRQAGSGIAYSRVRVSHEFVNSVSGRLQGASYLPYTIDTDNFVDKRDTDGYVYFNGAMSADSEYVTVVNGFDSAVFDSSAVSTLSGTTELLINVSVDAVQFNRYQQLWGMDTIPWRIDSNNNVEN